MKNILTMDTKNYDENLDEIYRIAVRGIIVINDKLLLIQSKLGEVKFPGGGQEDGEDDIQTLIRETLEETGYYVIKESITEFGEVVEKRLSTHEEKIWHQINRYYLCEVSEEKEQCNYTENENKHGFRQVLYTLDEAIKLNEDRYAKEGISPWTMREYQVLKLLKAYNLK